MLKVVKAKIVRLNQELYRMTAIYIASRLYHSRYMTLYIAHLKRCGVGVGRPTYIDYTVWLDPVDFSLITIEDDAILARGVVVLVHDYAITQGLKACGHILPKLRRFDSSVYIGKNVFVGVNAILKPGTHLSENCLVASGSVVHGRFSKLTIEDCQLTIVEFQLSTGDC